ncbi:MAG: hypothetical protein VW268_09690 [Rhodospirillaceae bacterium]
MAQQTEIDYHLERPLGPFLGDFSIPQVLVDRLNAFTDAVIADSGPIVTKGVWRWRSA